MLSGITLLFIFLHRPPEHHQVFVVGSRPLAGSRPLPSIQNSSDIIGRDVNRNRSRIRAVNRSRSFSASPNSRAVVLGCSFAIAFGFTELSFSVVHSRSLSASPSSRSQSLVRSVGRLLDLARVNRSRLSAPRTASGPRRNLSPCNRSRTHI